MHTLNYTRCDQEISRDIWKLLLPRALESWKNFCMLDNFVMFDDVYIMQHNAFLIFKSLCTMQQCCVELLNLFLFKKFAKISEQLAA